MIIQDYSKYLSEPKKEINKLDLICFVLFVPMITILTTILFTFGV